MAKKLVHPPEVGSLTTSQRVELHIKEAIVHGELKPRERTVELELARRSRAPVRQAVQRLIREG